MKPGLPTGSTWWSATTRPPRVPSLPWSATPSTTSQCIPSAKPGAAIPPVLPDSSPPVIPPAPAVCPRVGLQQEPRAGKLPLPPPGSCGTIGAHLTKGRLREGGRGELGEKKTKEETLGMVEGFACQPFTSPTFRGPACIPTMKVQTTHFCLNYFF